VWLRVRNSGAPAGAPIADDPITVIPASHAIYDSVPAAIETGAVVPEPRTANVYATTDVYASAPVANLYTAAPAVGRATKFEQHYEDASSNMH